MRSERVVSALALALFVIAGDVHAQDAGKPKGDAGAPASSANPGPVDPSAPLPSGHPMVNEADDQDEDDPRAAHQHAQGGGGGGFQPQAPKDGVLEDPTLPVGTIQVHAADVEGKPLARTEITLGILYNSVAKGESRKRVTALTDDTGTVVFKNLDAGTGVAYRAMILREGATFQVTPFVLTQKQGTRVLIHAYPIEKDIEKTLIATRGVTYVEVKDDRVQIQSLFELFNGGKSAWVPEDYVIPLPADFTAFSTSQGMTDVGADAIPKKGVKIHGTFSPGQHSIEFRWQLPYNKEAEVSFDVGMTPHMVTSRVIAPASRAMTLEVADFPQAQSTTDGTGQRVLVTEKTGGRQAPPITSVKVEIKNLPTEGPAKLVATFLAAFGLVIGGVVSAKKQTPRNLPGEREKILAALDTLEKAHAAGEVGPKTYERNRRNLLDDLARTYAAEPKTAKKKKATA